ncbi:MAG: M20/M25/M40 family metallo-hydrolase [Cytophagaceae bacterium]|nr:M20/M25/M40 family metallo-hydrolase [Cytophagaceae bacterium]
MKKLLLPILLVFLAFPLFAQQKDSVLIRRVFNEILARGKSYEWLRQLTTQVGPRLSGSPGAQKAVDWGKKTMEAEGFDRVFLQEVMVPHWVRGDKERAWIRHGKDKIDVPVAALGGSVGTPAEGITAGVIEVKNFQELRALGREKVAGKIVFFNRPMDPTKLNTFEAYAGAVDQRGGGATEASKLGAVGAIVRSMNPSLDDFPHTGSMRYGPGVPLIPAAAISTKGAERLSALLKQNPALQFYFKQSCETLDDVLSYNVVGEIKGSEKPNEIILVGGHLDSWDLAQGAHDDGAGCVQSIEVLRTLKVLGIRPRHTLRAVLFMNEENGTRGGIKYADLAKQNNETHVYAIESDNGGFTPRGFGIVGNDAQVAALQRFSPLLAPYGLHEIGRGSGGADIGPLAPLGTVLVGFKPDSQRYFDYHHAANDRFEAISERELKLGAASMAALVILLDGLDK